MQGIEINGHLGIPVAWPFSLVQCAIFYALNLAGFDIEGFSVPENKIARKTLAVDRAITMILIFHEH